MIGNNTKLKTKNRSTKKKANIKANKALKAQTSQQRTGHSYTGRKNKNTYGKQIKKGQIKKTW